jgi:hypothetical protein
LVAAALYDLKNEQSQISNMGISSQHMSTSEHYEHDGTNSIKQQETTIDNPSTGSIVDGQQFTNDGNNNDITRSNLIVVLVGEMGPEIPFPLGQFLLYKGHFLNLLHFPIWKVHTKTLLLKYDTVLADSEIAWEATDEVRSSCRIHLIE